MQEVKLDLYDGNANYLGSLDVQNSTTFPLALTQSVADMRDISKRSGIVSKTFKVVATANNNSLLKYIYNANVDAGSVIYGNRAVITVNGLPAMKGNLSVTNVYQEGSPQEYDLELLGDSLEWVYPLQAVNIGSLNYGNPQENITTSQGQSVTVMASTAIQTLDMGTVEASWEGSYDSGWDFVYSLKDYGQWANTNYVSITEMRPDLYIRAIIAKSFKSIGYQFVSNFFDSDFAKHLILPFYGDNFVGTNNKDMEFNVGLANNFTISNSSTQNTVTGAVLFNKRNHLGPGVNLNTGVITFLHSVRGTISLSFNGNIQGTGKLILNKNGVVVMTQSLTASQGSSALNLQYTYHDDFHVNDTVELFYSLDPKVLSNQPDKTLFFNSGTTLSFFSENAIIEGSQYQLSKVLPTMSCLDVLAGMINLFNLYFKTDTDNKIVYCEPRNQFYQPLTNAIDWTAKLDLNNEITTEFIDDYNRALQFTFTADSNDNLVTVWNTQHKLVAGSLEYDLPLRFPSGTQNLGTDIYSFTMINNPADGIVNCAAGIPTFWYGQGQPPAPTYDFAPRILYYEGYLQQNWAGTILGAWYWQHEASALAKFPLASLGNGQIQLNYNGSTGLVSNFYENDIAAIVEGKIIIVYLNLTPTDMLTLDMSRPVFLSHHNLYGYYFINQIIDYQPNKQQSTQVELVKAVAASLPNAINYSNEISTVTTQLNSAIGTGSGSSLGVSGLAQTTSTVLQNNTGNWAMQNAGALAIGNGLIAAGQNQQVLGNYNTVSTTDLFQVGAGTSAQDRSRGITLTQDGNLLVQGGYVYTTSGQEVLFASQQNSTNRAMRLDKVHLIGN